MGRDQLRVVLALGSTQTIAWASSYYLPAILADPIAHDIGVSSTEVFAAFSISLIASAFLGPRIGRTIDVFGGRGVLVVSNVVLAFGLAALGLAHSQAVMWLAWVVIGLGMSLGLRPPLAPLPPGLLGWLWWTSASILRSSNPEAMMSWSTTSKPSHG